MNEKDALQNQVHEDLLEIQTSEETEMQDAQPTDSTDGSAAFTETDTSGEAEYPDGGEDCAIGDISDEVEEDLPTPDGQDQDPDPSTANEDPAMVRMRALEAELADLRAELMRRDEEAVKIERECAEFQSLYPNVSLASLRDEVWESVKDGLPIAAAYALSERKQFLRQQKAAEINKENQKRSAGSLSGTESNYFSPTEVRAMSPAEVRINYKKIMTSMQKWN